MNHARNATTASFIGRHGKNTWNISEMIDQASIPEQAQFSHGAALLPPRNIVISAVVK